MPCASIDLKITKLYENPEKPPNPTEMFSIFFGIKRLGPRSTHTISHPNFLEKKMSKNPTKTLNTLKPIQNPIASIDGFS